MRLINIDIYRDYFGISFNFQILRKYFKCGEFCSYLSLNGEQKCEIKI